jgi:thioredoxin reductase
MTDPLTFFFEGEPVAARPGQSLASALGDAGIRVFRETGKGSPRGVFCGMGVCQDCLLEVDGRPNQRACMTPVAADLNVRRQTARASLRGKDRIVTDRPAPAAARVLTPDVLVVGAGSGGLNAAIAAAGAGAGVLVLDERKVAGGQYFKQPAEGLSLLDGQQREGAELLAQARASGAELMSGIELWAAFEGPELYAGGPAGEVLIFRPRQLIVATGAYERPRLVPGWTLPGVMTTGAAQTLWRSYRSLPGKRMAVFGSGPLNLQVALELARGGADVRVVTERAPSPWLRPLTSLALFASSPRLALAGMAMHFGLLRERVALRYDATLQAIEEAASGALNVHYVCGAKAFEVEVDALCMNDGFEPQNELLRLLGASMHYDPVFGQLRCQRGADCETSIPGVFAIGDCCGLGGAPAAAAEGVIAGAAAARACGHEGAPVAVDSARKSLAKARRFQELLWKLHDPSPQPLAGADDSLVLCRCEEITLGDFRAALDQENRHIGAIKSAPRLGMGCCQGRYCGPAAARLHAERTGRSVEDLSYFAPQVPIKPVSIDVIEATAAALGSDD